MRRGEDTNERAERISLRLSRKHHPGTLIDMATFRDGNVRRATANTVKAMKRSAERRTCPACERKSALVSDAEGRMTYCRWTQQHDHRGVSLCGYVSMWDYPKQCNCRGDRLVNGGIHMPWCDSVRASRLSQSHETPKGTQ